MNNPETTAYKLSRTITAPTNTEATAGDTAARGQEQHQEPG